MFFMTEDYALVKKNNVIIIFGFQCVCYYFLKGQKAIRKMLESEARDRRHATITDSRDQVADAHWERLRAAPRWPD